MVLATVSVNLINLPLTSFSPDIPQSHGAPRSGQSQDCEQLPQREVGSREHRQLAALSSSSVPSSGDISLGQALPSTSLSTE